MSSGSDTPSRSLPVRPNLRHLKKQAKDLLRTHAANSMADAQFKIARSYGFPSWPKLKAFVESSADVAQLKQAIDTNDFDRIVLMMTRNPSLHTAPLGYRNNGPLTWVAECRVPYQPPTPTRVAIARWMIEHGSDVHQGGDGPLMRAALHDDRIAMMELLVAYGADVNAMWDGHFPIVLAPCETLSPAALRWLLAHGANPNCVSERTGSFTALDYVVGTYARSPRLGACIEALLNVGGATRYDVPVVWALLRSDLDGLAEHLDRDNTLLNRRFAELEFGATGNRRLSLKGSTLLHVAAEYGNLDAARVLLDRGANVNAVASIDESGVGGQTPIFHAATQFNDFGFTVAKLLIDRGADLLIRAKLPGHHEQPDEFVEVTSLEYATLFPGTSLKTLNLLRARDASHHRS